jgi:hypothetical protein
MPPDPGSLARAGRAAAPHRRRAASDTIAPHAGVLPDAWSPPSLDPLQRDYPGLDIANELQQFAAYHRAKGSRYLSWDRAFEGWLAKSAEFQRRDRGTKRTTATTTRAEQVTTQNRRRRDETLARFDEIPEPPPPEVDRAKGRVRDCLQVRSNGDARPCARPIPIRSSRRSR